MIVCSQKPHTRWAFPVEKKKSAGGYHWGPLDGPLFRIFLRLAFDCINFDFCHYAAFSACFDFYISILLSLHTFSFSKTSTPFPQKQSSIFQILRIELSLKQHFAKFYHNNLNLMILYQTSADVISVMKFEAEKFAAQPQ